MCGIAFLYDPTQDVGTSKARVSRALDRMQHRGPDGEGISTRRKAVLGHRRLAIIDLAASHQPMTDATGRYSLTYNGEIYNYKDVRRALEPRWGFCTRGDTEVLLAGLVLEGVGFLSRLEGMWSFAFWDSVEQRVLLARDRMGKKPLYYGEEQGAFACSSELPALRSLMTKPWREDIDSTADYLRYGYCLPGYTSYEGVFEVRPGHWLTWSPFEQIRSEPYWSLRAVCLGGSTHQDGERVKSALVASVERRLVADVEVGAFLSGGIDSSLIVGILARYLDRRPKTFTVGFSEASYDERPYARQVATLFGTEHFDECIESMHAHELHELVLGHLGQPFLDSSLLPTALVSRWASKQVKVVLSGDGGDELFSGYQRYQARAIMRWYTRLPARLRRFAERALKKLPEPMVHHSRSILKKAHLFVDVARRVDEETPYIAPVLYAAGDFAELAPELPSRGHPGPGLPEVCELDDVARMMLADALVYMPQDILVKVDRATMASSLEARAPFLDRALVELAFSMPRHSHRRWGVGKRMLRHAFADLLPSGIWRRRKQGFAVPVHQWFRGELSERLRQLIAEVQTPLQSRFVLDLLAAHRVGRQDHGYRLWQIYTYLLWKANRTGY